MRTKVLAVGLLLCGLVVGVGAQSKPANKIWEYHIDYGLSTERANKLGTEGWELVTTAREDSHPNTMYIYKRAR